MKTWQFYSEKLSKISDGSHVKKIDEMKHQGCRDKFLHELDENYESLLKPYQFQLDMTFCSIT